MTKLTLPADDCSSFWCFPFTKLSGLSLAWTGEVQDFPLSDYSGRDAEGAVEGVYPCFPLWQHVSYPALALTLFSNWA